MFSRALSQVARRGALLGLPKSGVSLTNCKTYSSAHPPLSALSQEEVMLQESIRRFAEDQIRPLVSKMDEAQHMERSVIDGCFEQGLMGMEIPEKYGGGGMSFTCSVLAIEELAKVDPSVSVCVDVQNTLINNAFINYGSDTLKKKYLPMLAQNTLASFGLSEWGSGTDAFAMKTTAEDKGDHFVLNGGKAWITNSAEAGLFLIFANVDPSKGHRGITAFVVERGTEGLTVGKKEDKLGIRASSTCELIIEDLKVSRENILGEVGKGYKIAIGTLNEGRIGIAAQMLGLAEGCYALTMPYLAERKQFNTRIADFQGMQHQYANAYMEIHASKLLTYEAARLKDAGKPFIREASMAKLYASQVAERTASTCVNMLGGVGFTKEFGVEKYFRDCKIGQIYEGTSNIQLQTIAKQILADL
mmetsp:Transcript_32734/g.82121  ORF Transcript_32734/g.82121 Transcript_32734/m.82121 type:complete len:417 (+) Transcript_32734:67-1317(+)|eukprot:CAMPEP_0177655828 /NCGR_PEP_ID=MMETSP0447-20121125/15197_1 /TAXON_ID=0 /ORGANISM="Stygamoeba regulata, Strain BSH-02190019" /LENGTH=416 /DNA_ID=CAMNT_0019159817 /DNA_START=67 /DNA_END=1317 /DNA_ORIENTATION=-